MLTEKRCRELTQHVVLLSKADGVQVSLAADEIVHQRFARNVPSSAGWVRDDSISIRSTFGTQSATASGNQLDSHSLEALVRRSESLARQAPEDPEFLAALGPQSYASVSVGTAESGAGRLEYLNRGVEHALGRARRSGLVAAGFAEAREMVRSIGNSAGLFGYHRQGDAHFSETVRTPDGRGSGWASTAAGLAGELDFEGPTESAIHKARRSAGARTLAAGDYPAVLEPACVASLMGFLVEGMDMRRADEGRNFFSLAGDETRLGERLFPVGINLVSDPGDGTVSSVPWAEDGTPHRRTHWIRDGVVENLHCDRYWARERSRRLQPFPPNTLMGGGEDSLEQLIEGTERGVLVTNLWYIRSVDPKTMLCTGLTRDGVFWIENGRVTHPVNNFRWNDSPVHVLQEAEALSKPVRVGGRNGRSIHAFVPAIRVASFGFSSVSEAV
ncbi:MAG: peptidase C69 [Planctomycetes bacterium]|jgi:predicted Zn-dependent protease|nr:peptidase C69 [Planctomycetota bacterium]